MDKRSLKVVYDDELLALLKQLGIQEAFETGRLKCFFCGDVVTLDNLHSLFPLSGDVKLVCMKPECVMALVRHCEERKNKP